MKPPDGERVARHFFENPELQRERTYQAIEAGGRLDSAEDAVDRLSNIGTFLAGDDAYFSYPAATHEEGGPAPPRTPGAVISFAKGDSKVRSRVDMVPRDEEAMERYGPEFVLEPAEREAGQRAAERLQQALQEGTGVEIEEGLDITFTRMPPGLDDVVGQRLTGGKVKLGRVESARRSVPLLAFLEDVRAIEAWAGVEYDLPEELSGDEARKVAMVAHDVRNGGYWGTWDDLEMTVPTDNIQPLRDGRVVRWKRQVAANVLGRVVDLGYTQVDIGSYVIASEQAAPDQPGYTVVRLEPGSPESASVFERLVKKPTATARRPPPRRARRGSASGAAGTAAARRVANGKRHGGGLTAFCRRAVRLTCS